MISDSGRDYPFPFKLAGTSAPRGRTHSEPTLQIQNFHQLRRRLHPTDPLLARNPKLSSLRPIHIHLILPSININLLAPGLCQSRIALPPSYSRLCLWRTAPSLSNIECKSLINNPLLPLYKFYGEQRVDSDIDCSVMAPLTRLRSPNHVPTDLVGEYYEQRASDGGLLITEGTLISPMV